MHLRNIRRSLPDDGRKYLVSIILDGENAWEYYRNNGWDFLTALYDKLAIEPGVETVRVCDFMQQNPPTDKLHHLFSGSWINHNFRIWIGHEEDNKAWDYLLKARLALESSQSADAVAWKELYISEGSDWCWWYGDDHSSDNDEAFDQLFRKHLKNIYHIIGKPYPPYLDLPIKQVAMIKPTREPTYLLTPVLDGEITNYYEWLAAGFYDISKLKGAMHQAETVVRALFYGYDTEKMHVRLDVNLQLMNSEAREIFYVILVSAPSQRRIKAYFDGDKQRYVLDLYEPRRDGWQLMKTLDSVAIKDIVELSVPFADIGAKAGDEVQFMVVVSRDSQELERWPRGKGVAFNVPAADFLERQWSV